MHKKPLSAEGHLVDRYIDRNAVANSRVVICDDHPLTRQALRDECEELGCVVIGDVGKGAEAIDLVLKRKPDLLILDQSLPDLDGPEVLRAIRARGGTTKVLVFTGYTNSGRFYEWIHDPAGPDGVLDKGSSMYELRAAMIAVLTSDTRYIPLDIQQREQGDGRNPLSRLGPRELEVLRFVANGLRLPQIAAHLNLTPHTVRSYMTSIYTKLDLTHNTLQGATAAYHRLVGEFGLPTGKE